MDIELAPYTSPPPGGALSLERARPLPRSAPGGQQAHDLRWFDSFPDHPERRITPQKMFMAFAAAEAGYPQLQVDLIKGLTQGDAHARNLFDHRDRVVGNKPLVFDSGDDSEEATDAAAVMKLAWSLLPTKQAMVHLLKSTRYGFAGIELDWDIVEYRGRAWVVPSALTLVPARRFRIGVSGMIPVKGEAAPVRIDELRLYRDIAVPQGEPLEPGKWLTIVRETSEVARSGLGVTAAPLMMIKRFTVRDWVVLSERYGIPFPIVKYGEQGDQESLDAAREILKRIGTDAGAAVTKDIDIEIVDGVKAKDPMQECLARFCNNELSKLVNGSTLRNDNTGAGSYGLGDVHDSVAWDEVRDDGEMVSEAINLQICQPFRRFNRLKSPAPVASLVVEPDLGPAQFMALTVKYVNELGGAASLSQVRQRSGIRAPIGPEDKAPGMQVPAFPIPAGGNP